MTITWSEYVLYITIGFCRIHVYGYIKATILNAFEPNDSLATWFDIKLRDGTGENNQIHR